MNVTIWVRHEGLDEATQMESTVPVRDDRDSFTLTRDVLERILREAGYQPVDESVSGNG